MPKKKLGREIKQIAAAGGMLAAYKDDETGQVTKWPLLCVALCDLTETDINGTTATRETVEGMLPSGHFVVDQPGFIGYTLNHEGGVTVDPFPGTPKPLYLRKYDSK